MNPALAPVILALTLTPVVQPEDRASKSICFLVDVSGSMDASRSATAISAFLTFSQQPIDEMKLAVIAFADHPVVCKFEGKTWAKLPDRDVIVQARAFLEAQAGDGGTYLSEGLKRALSLDEPELTVVVITDGDLYHERTDWLLACLRKWQSHREKPALIGFVGVGHARAKNVLITLAKEGKGGYYLAR